MAGAFVGSCDCTCVGCSSPTITGTIKGCTSLGLSGATVAAHDSTAGGTLLGSTTTSGTGTFSLSGLTGAISGDSIVLVISMSPRFSNTNAPLTYTAGTPSGGQWSCGKTTTMAAITLTPAPGYTCLPGSVSCALPLSNTLHVSITQFPGAQTLTYSGGEWTTNLINVAGWAGCTGYPCPATSVNIAVSFNPAAFADMQLSWHCNSLTTCPGPADSGHTALCPSSDAGPSSFTCPPSFSASYSLTGLIFCTGACATTCPATALITE